MKAPVQATVEVVDHSNASSASNCFHNARTSHHEASVHYRGQSSLHFSKHQLGVSLNQASSFLGFPADREFVLHGPLIDSSLMRNHLAHWLYRSTARYSPRTRHVVLFLRDSADPTNLTPVYKGIYLALEKITYGPNRVGLAPLSPACVTDDELSGGWAWQINPLDYGVYSPNLVRDEFETAFGAGERPALMHPHPNVLTQRMRNFFVDPRTGPLPRLYEFLYTNMTMPDELETHVDVGSFVDYFLHSEMSQNTDAYRRSTYFFKDRGEPINAGPVWDFNLAYGKGANQAQWLFTPFSLWKRLVCHYKFASLAIQRWRALRQSVWSADSIRAFLNSSAAPISRQLARCSNWTSGELYCANVRAGGGSFRDNLQSLLETVEARAKWIDEHVGGLYMALNGTACVPLGTLPQYNCAANGSDSGCLTDPDRYVRAVSFPSVRHASADKICETKATEADGASAHETPSLDFCWLSVGAPVAQSTLTQFCSGHGYCEAGPNAACKCVHGKQPPACADLQPPACADLQPPPLHADEEEGTHLVPRALHHASSTASRGFAWGLVIAVLCVVAAGVRLYARKSRGSSRRDGDAATQPLRPDARAAHAPSYGT